MEEHKLDETNGTPKSVLESEDESGKTSCWNRVGAKIKDFFVLRFVKDSFFSFVETLRSKFGCQIEVSLHERITRDISIGQHDISAKQMSDTVFHHLKPGTGSRVPSQVEIQTEEDRSTKLMRNWLNQQEEQHKRKMDRESCLTGARPQCSILGPRSNKVRVQFRALICCEEYKRAHCVCVGFLPHFKLE